jgi:hypothetical protein
VLLLLVWWDCCGLLGLDETPLLAHLGICLWGGCPFATPTQAASFASHHCRYRGGAGAQSVLLTMCVCVCVCVCVQVEWDGDERK